MGIALWKEQNNSVLEQVVGAFSTELNQENSMPVKKLLKKSKTNRIHLNHRLFQTRFCYISNMTPLTTTLCGSIPQVSTFFLKHKSQVTPMQGEILLESSPLMLPPIPLICLLYSPALNFRLKSSVLKWHIIWHQGCAHANTFTLKTYCTVGWFYSCI